MDIGILRKHLKKSQNAVLNFFFNNLSLLSRPG